MRPGGLVIADNALWGGRVVDPASDDPATRGVREFNARFAAEPRLVSTVIAVNDGIAVGAVRV